MGIIRMNVFAILIIGLLIEVQCNSIKMDDRGEESKIIGSSAEIKDFPYVVSIQTQILGKYILLCSGSLIRMNVVLTVADCFYSTFDKMYSPSSLRVVAGTSEWSDTSPGEVAEVSQLIPHSLFKMPKNSFSDHSIGIVKLKRAFTLPMLKAINWRRESSKSGELCTIAGWDATKAIIDQIYSKHLHSAEVPIVPNDVCNQIYLGLVTNNQICAGGLKNAGICVRDAGSPLVCGGELTGIAYFASGICAIEGIPGVFTEVAEYATWIDSIVSGVGKFIPNINLLVIPILVLYYFK